MNVEFFSYTAFENSTKISRKWYSIAANSLAKLPSLKLAF